MLASASRLPEIVEGLLGHVGVGVGLAAGEGDIASLESVSLANHQPVPKHLTTKSSHPRPACALSLSSAWPARQASAVAERFGCVVAGDPVDVIFWTFAIRDTGGPPGPATGQLTPIPDGVVAMPRTGGSCYDQRKLALGPVTLSDHAAPLRMSQAEQKRSGLSMAAKTTVALALVVLAVIWGFTPISRFANPEAVAAAMAVVSASPWQFAFVLGCYLGAGLVVFPMLLLVITCAAVFGPVLGFVYSSTGLLASAALNYAIGKWLGRELLLKVLGSRRFDSVLSALIRRGLITTAVVRAIPMSPFAVVSVVAGASAIRFPDYLMGTALGIMVPVILLTLATEQTSQLLTEPSAIKFAMLVGVIVLWIAVAFGAQAVLERIAKGQGRNAR
jgi:uncharacterized membrane protein YdjX (TVP38/TMEM64 family)